MSELRKIREAANVRQADVAARMGFCRQRIGQFENGPVSSEIAQQFRKAVCEIVIERAAIQKAVLKVRRRFCDSQN